MESVTAAGTTTSTHHQTPPTVRGNFETDNNHLCIDFEVNI